MKLPPAHLHPDVFLVLGSVLGLYLWAWRKRSTIGADPQRRRRTTFFAIGMGVLLLGSSWPIHDLAEEYLFGVHMVQHMMYQLIAAPLLLVGIPAWMWRAILRPAWMMAVWKSITRAVPALIIFNALLLFTHWPAVVDLALRSELAHFCIHFAMVIAAIVMWWPVLSPLPEAPALVPPLQMLYLFLQSLAPTIPASFLTFGEQPIYKIYATFPRIWPNVSAMADQRAAGLIMKLAGGLILWGFITVIFFRWYFDEQREQDVEEALRLQESAA